MAAFQHCFPAVVFAYRRPHHLARTVTSLLANPEARFTPLHVYCDGARGPEDARDVDEVRRYAQSIAGFASVTRTYRRENMGLATSIITGVSEVLEQRGAAIVLEDDLVLSRHFLRYMNEALTCYAEDERVASVHGYCYPVDVPLPETFFLTGADCWGWATWSRAWKNFQPDGRRLLDELNARDMAYEFDLDGVYPFTRMLEDQVKGRNESWAIRWHASCCLADLLTLYPGRSLVHNIGTDSTGTHCGTTDDYAQRVAVSPVVVRRIPLAPSAEGRAAFRRFLGARQSVAERARRLLGRVMRRQP
jgi:hypothetical protein